MTRIVAGAAGGRRLSVPRGGSTRPTSDRAREGLFGTLASLDAVTGARVLDLYAGSGAVALEALSRGAAYALCVESTRAAADVIRANAAALGLTDRCAVWQKRAEQVAAKPCPDGPYDVVYADPPYAVRPEQLAGVLRALVDNGWLAQDAVVAVERSGRDPEWRWPTPLVADRERRYGEASIWYGRRP